MRKLFLILMILVLLVPVFAQPNDYDYLKLVFEKNLSAEITEGGSISQLSLISNHNPMGVNNSTYINNLSTSMDYRYVNDSFLFEFEDLSERDFQANMVYVIEKVRYFPKVTEAPYEPKEGEYTEFTEVINVNEDISEKASEIASGKKDAYVISSGIARWIENNFEYNLETQKLHPNATSVWVYENRKGTCKELTSLFVSMTRSLGLPSRVVIGYAYTDDKRFDENWGRHAWAEVKIDGKWVPFDVTYEEYGKIDSSHIEFLRLKGFDVPKDRIKMSGRDVKIKSFTNSNNIKVLKERNLADTPQFELDIEAADSEVDFGSESYLKVTYENKENYYRNERVFLSYPEKVEVGQVKKNLVLKPNEKKTVYWSFKVPDDLDDSYVWTLPFTVISGDRNETVKVKVSDEYEMVEMNPPVNESMNTTPGEFDMQVECRTGYNGSYVYVCSFKNKGARTIEDYKVCFNEECSKRDFLLNEEKELSYVTTDTKVNVTYGNAKRELVFVEPNLDFDYEKKNDTLLVNYSVENFSEGWSVKAFMNGTGVHQGDGSAGMFRVPLEEGNNSVRLALYMDNFSYSEKSFSVFKSVSSEKDKDRGENQGLFDRISSFFGSLFSFF